MLDRLILGDNQFFGVNHMSEEKGMSSARRFQSTKAITDVLDMAYSCGIRAFSFSTHDRVQEICDYLRAHRDRFADLKLYPVLPYAHKYANAVAEKGIVGTLMDVVVSDNSLGKVASMVARGGSILMNKNPVEIMKLLVDAEMKMFRKLDVRVVFLQNIVTDLLLGLGWHELFRDFASYVEDSYGARAGFMTLNMPRLVDFLLAAGIENPIVCSAINKIGFQMNPDVASYEETLRTRSFQAMAMSILAAGAVKPREAIEYVAGLQGVQSILFGASSRSHVEEIRGLADRAA